MRAVSSVVRVAENSPGVSPIVSFFCTCSVCGATLCRQWLHLTTLLSSASSIPVTQLKAYWLQLETHGPEQWLTHKTSDAQSTFKFSNTPYLRLLTKALPRNKCISIILLAKILKENNDLILFKLKAKCATNKTSREKEGSKLGDTACF